MPRMAVKAGHDLIDVVVAGPARGRKEGDGQTNDDREKGLVHDRASILLGEVSASHSAGRAVAGPAPCVSGGSFIPAAVIIGRRITLDYSQSCGFCRRGRCAQLRIGPQLLAGLADGILLSRTMIIGSNRRPVGRPIANVWGNRWETAPHALNLGGPGASFNHRADRPASRQAEHHTRLPRASLWSASGSAMPYTIPEGFIPVSDAFEQAVSELADFSQLSIDQTASDDEQRDYFNKYDEIVRGVEKKMRRAVADRGLPLFIDTPNGPRELVERKEWGELAFGVPNIENLSHHLTNPGVDTDGQPSFLKISDFRDWLTAHNSNNSSALVDAPTSSSPALNMPKEMSELAAAKAAVERRLDTPVQDVQRAEPRVLRYGRREGESWPAGDVPAYERMAKLIDQRKAQSVNEAANIVAPEFTRGDSKLESTAKRLRDNYNRWAKAQAKGSNPGP
jgi:hypothetical protein